MGKNNKEKKEEKTRTVEGRNIIKVSVFKDEFEKLGITATETLR